MEITKQWDDYNADGMNMMQYLCKYTSIAYIKQCTPWLLLMFLRDILVLSGPSSSLPFPIACTARLFSGITKSVPAAGVSGVLWVYYYCLNRGGSSSGEEDSYDGCYSSPC